MSKRIPFNNDWLFHDGEIKTEFPAMKGPVYTQSKTENKRRGPAAVYYDDKPDDFVGAYPMHELTHEKWEKVTLPHDYMIDSIPKETGNNALCFYDYRNAWYRKHFTLDESYRGKKIEIEFCGVTVDCDVYVNGIYMQHNATAYTPFVIDISDFAKFDTENVIAVHVMTENFENWWYAGGGITRKVWLNVSERVAVERYGVFLAPKKINDREWNIPTEVTVENSGFADKEASVKVEIYGADGAFVTEASGSVKVEGRSTALCKLIMSVTDPKLWDIDDPVLYKAVTTVTVDGELTDTHEDNFGFRTIEFTAESGFFLNGRSVFINGVCGHEDFALTGRAVPDNIMRHKVRLIKEMGANGYRCSHYMADEEFMNAFDKYGLLVMAETRHFSSTPNHMNELRTLIKRDRNRPSVVLWSIGNEEHLFITDQGRRIAEAMTFEVKRLDGTRPVMTANDKKPEVCTVYDASDIVAINYNLPIYDTVREQIPNKCFISSEAGAAGTTRGWYYADNPAKGYINAYDHDINLWFRSREYTYKSLRAHSYVAAYFQWTGLEYRGEAVWPRLCSQSGAVDLFLQKKDAFYQNLSHWSEKPMVHLLPHWNMEGRTDLIPVWAYTNCPKAELFLNGRSLGIKEVEKYGHAEWQVAFEKGEILVKAYDCNGNTVAEDKQITSGRSYSLKLKLENGGDIRANGEDVAIYTCYCVDENGNEVPTANPEVTFATGGYGTIIGTGSDIADHTKVKLATRKMRAGRILVGVRVGDKAGKITLYAESDGLITATHEYEVK